MEVVVAVMVIAGCSCCRVYYNLKISDKRKNLLRALCRRRSLCGGRAIDSKAVKYVGVGRTVVVRKIEGSLNLDYGSYRLRPYHCTIIAHLAGLEDMKTSPINRTGSAMFA